MAQGNTLVNALLGAVATVVLTPLVPFAPVLGGMAAGYLEGGTREDGLWVGAVSGGIALVPLLLLSLLVGVVLFFITGASMGLPGMLGPPGAREMVGLFPALFGGFGLIALAFAVFFAIVYTVGLSALGGWLGNYVRSDTDIGRSA